MSVKPNIVYGEDCLNWINKAVGFVGHNDDTKTAGEMSSSMCQTPTHFGEVADPLYHYFNTTWGLYVWQWERNYNKRVVGVVREILDDGGLVVDVYGTDTLKEGANGNIKSSSYLYSMQCRHKYNCVEIRDPYSDSLFDCDMTTYPQYPLNNDAFHVEGDSSANCRLLNAYSGNQYDYDYMLEAGLDFRHGVSMSIYDGIFAVNGAPTGSTVDLSNNVLQFGYNVTDVGYDSPDEVYEELCDNPFNGCVGNIYGFFTYMCRQYATLMLGDGTKGGVVASTKLYANNRACKRWNGSALIYNMILTESLTFANDYLANGTLPQDAFLYPLDWDNLPSWSENPDDDDNPSDNPDDVPDDNDPDDDSWDIDDDPPTDPFYTPFGLSNYNWYWLSAPDYEAFIHWFWHDVGDNSDFDDFINKIKGLYNDLASAIMMVRYMPVEPSWIGGLGNQDTIKLGMIEKGGFVDTLVGNTPHVRTIGRIKIDRRYKSFLDYAPYSQLSLYLPYHGFIDLDINIFMNNYILVYGVYDILSGTIQYFIYCELPGNNGKFVVNTVVAKMGVDIPITLQTKSDRDSSIFQNVSSVVGGLIGAGVGVASGNPIGMALGVTSGVQAMTSTNASAPLNVKGNIAESGSFYAPNKCRIVLRRPTIQASDKGNNKKETWLKHVGRTACYGYYVGKDGKNTLKGAGLTQCENPRINFTNTTPLQKEVEEIYSILEKGVIL